MIETVRVRSPVNYLRAAVAILPKDFNVSMSAVEGMTNDELNATIKKLLTDPAMAEMIDEIRGDREFEGTC